MGRFRKADLDKAVPHACQRAIGAAEVVDKWPKERGDSQSGVRSSDDMTALSGAWSTGSEYCVLCKDYRSLRE